MQIETPQAVAIYCRLSKEDLDENKIDNLSRSIQNQKSMLTDFAEINGWQIFDIYCDDNLSGVARDRPEFNRLIRDASLRKFNIILCKNQSRFTRDMQLVEKYIHGLFPIWGIRFVGMVDGADTSVKGNKKARQINGLVNQWYLENLSDNIKATLKLKRIRGKYTGSVLPYGYRPDPDDINCFIIDPVAASVVKQGRKPELTIFTSKKRTFPQAFSVRKSVVQAVEKFLQKEKLYVKRDTNVPFSARPEKKPFALQRCIHIREAS